MLAGAFLLCVACAGTSPQLAVIGGVVGLLGAQTLLHTGALIGYPRRRRSAVAASVVAVLLIATLVGIRLYAGPEAWAG